MWCSGQSVLHTLLLLSTVSFSIHHVHCGRAVILTGPEDQIAAPGETVYFNCHARGDSVYWRIDYNYPHPDDAARGITYTYNEIPRPNNELEEHNNTVTIEARPENNNTLVSCVATGQISNQQDRRDGHLIIAGSPLPPSVNYDMEYAGNDTVSFIFRWNESYTWSGFPVTSYTYKMINQSSGEIIYSNNISQRDTLQYWFATSGNSCYKLTFSISANNSLGRGNWSHTLIGHPLIIGELGEIETLITFHVNGTPHFWMSFLAPNICPEYQTGTYSITIYSSDGDGIVYDFGSTVYHQRIEGVRELITKEVRTGLNVSEMYTVTVSVESIDVTHSRNKTFYTNFTAACQCTTTIDEMGPTCSPTEAGSSVGVIIGAVIVIIIIGILIAVIIIMAFLLAQKRKLSRDEPDGQQLIGLPNKNSRRAHANNPIYEGAAMYETTPGESFRSLDSLNDPRRSATPSADLTLHYVDVPPNLPPPRGADKQLLSEPEDEIAAIKASIKQAQLELPVPHQTVEEEYIVMGPKHVNNSNGHVKRSVDEELMTDGEEKYVALDSLR